MGDLSNEPSMEDILSSIKRIIAEEHDGATPGRGRRIGRAAPSPDPEPAIEDEQDPAGEAVLELDQPVSTPEPETEAEMPPAPTRKPQAQTSDETILSARVAEATRGQLESLSRLVVKPEVAGSDTLEGMVREMLRPMLSDWLDSNLPRIVETMVAREIARISGRADR